MKGKRGRPPLTQAEKDARKSAKEADAQQKASATAMAKLPADQEKRNDLWREGEQLKSKAQGIAGEISQHKKRLHEVFGITKAAMKIRAILIACSDGEYEATVQQTELFMRDFNRPFQMSMFGNEAGSGPKPEDFEGAVFDNTSAGKARGGAKAQPKAATPKSSKSNPPIPPKDTGKLSEDEALKGFQDAKEKADKKGSKKSDPPAPPSKAATNVVEGKFKTEEQIAAERAELQAQRARDGAEFDGSGEEEEGDEGPLNSPFPGATGRGDHVVKNTHH